MVRLMRHFNHARLAAALTRARRGRVPHIETHQRTVWLHLGLCARPVNGLLHRAPLMKLAHGSCGCSAAAVIRAYPLIALPRKQRELNPALSAVMALNAFWWAVLSSVPPLTPGRAILAVYVAPSQHHTALYAMRLKGKVLFHAIYRNKEVELLQ